jgi:hypothetical protein
VVHDGFRSHLSQYFQPDGDVNSLFIAVPLVSRGIEGVGEFASVAPDAGLFEDEGPVIVGGVAGYAVGDQDGRSLGELQGAALVGLR